MTTNYDKDAIHILSDLEHIRRRRGMYIGESKNPNPLFNEIFDNSLDELQAGHADTVIVELNYQRGYVRVVDDGRGIPHGVKTVDGKDVLIVAALAMKSFSGGKFSEGAYKISTGLHGLGMTVTNALSTKMDIVSYRNGQAQRVRFMAGTPHMTTGDAPDRTGTEVVFYPDPTIFGQPMPDDRHVRDRIRVATALIPGIIRLKIADTAGEYTNELFSGGQVLDLLPDEPDVISYPQTEQVITVSSPNGERLVLGLRYTNATDEKVVAYTNLLRNSQGGTHAQMALSAIKAAFEPLLKGREILRDDTTLGVRLVVAAFLIAPEYSSQTKEKLVVRKDSLNGLVADAVRELQAWLFDTANAKTIDGMLARFEEHRRYQNQFASQKTILKQIHIEKPGRDGTVRRKSVVPRLSECTTPRRDEAELFICEGDSAGGSMRSARDVRTQAILPIRGKILNVTGQKLDRIFKNAEVRDIVSAIGAGYGASADPELARYGKIILASDADPDGRDITALLLGVLVNLVPLLVREGLVYVAQPPLFGWYDKKGVFAYGSDAAQVPKNAARVIRFKGLGEMSPNELKASCMDPARRDLIQVAYPADLKKFNRMLGESAGRREVMVSLGLIAVAKEPTLPAEDESEDAPE